MKYFTESEIEFFSLNILKQLRFSYIPGPAIAPDVEATQGFLIAEAAMPYGAPEKRESYGDVVLKQTLERAIKCLSPVLMESAWQKYLRGQIAIQLMKKKEKS